MLGGRRVIEGGGRGVVLVIGFRIGGDGGVSVCLWVGSFGDGGVFEIENCFKR